MNPFMITSNQSYGIQLDKLKATRDILKKNENKEENDNNDATENEEQHDLSFLYTRESDRIGEGVQLSDHPLAKQFRMKNKKRNQIVCAQEKINSTIRYSQDEVKGILDQYNHAPKDESPLYSTTANSIGLKKPSIATYTSQRYARSQQFSKSFNRTMYRDHGLNMSLTKS